MTFIRLQGPILGPEGPMGPDGLIGLQGPIGMKGEKGERGSQGTVQGQKGNPGLQLIFVLLKYSSVLSKHFLVLRFQYS